MKRTILALAVLSSASLLVSPMARGQAPTQPGKGLPFDLGPGDKGATLKQPWLETGTPPAATPPPTQGFIQGFVESASPKAVQGPSSLVPYDTTGINNDILVTPELGEWMIMVASYSGREGPMRARKMVVELRRVYRLPAYVFNFGAEEKRKELERVTRLIEQQKAELKAQGITSDQPIHVRHARIEEHCAVLIGGYPNVDAANKVRNELKRIEPDPKVFMLEKPGDLFDVKFYTPNPDSKGETRQDATYVNPFTRAIPVRNPAVKHERPVEKLDISVLRRINADERYNLLKCNKRFTLVIKQFNMLGVATARNDPAPSTAGWDPLGAFKKSADPVDYAAENAHRLAEALRLGNKLEAYVMHTKHYSLVTIGGYDSLEDPHLRSMQNIIETRLVPQMQAMELFPKAMPMEIPH
jgi:hypothetical protein